jgi:phosphatidylserine decarboxylase
MKLMKPSWLNVLPQYLVPQHALSRLAGWLSNCRWHWLKTWEISYFIKRYNVAVDEAVSGRLEDYPTFNSFFTRYLQPGKRMITSDPDAIASPADGGVSQIGVIQNDLLLQAKGFHFSLRDLLGGDAGLAQTFSQGCFATIYLSPRDYHRVHMPLTGTLQKTIFIPGKLFSVNQKTARNVPQLFSRNERLICIFETALGPMALILVGAMLVGSIKTVWDDSARSTKIVTKDFTHDVEKIRLERGAEMGHFAMGSTVIILFPQQKVTWQPELKENSFVHMGEPIAKIHHP